MEKRDNVFYPLYEAGVVEETNLMRVVLNYQVRTGDALQITEAWKIG